MYKERSPQIRKIFLQKLQNIDPLRLVYVDESGIDRYMRRSYGWSPKGEKVYGEVSGHRYHRESFIAGKIGSKVIAPMCYKGTCDTLLFNTWLSKILLPELKPGYIIVMDNASFHKSVKTKELIESHGCKLLFLPPYSPDLNPIEKFWAVFKKKISYTINQYKNLQEAIDATFCGFCFNLF